MMPFEKFTDTFVASDDLGPLLVQLLHICGPDGYGISTFFSLHYGEKRSLPDDRQWLLDNPDRWTRLRKPIGVEKNFGRAATDGDVLRVLVLITNKVNFERQRFIFACPPISLEAAPNLDDKAVTAVVIDYSNFARRHFTPRLR